MQIILDSLDELKQLADLIYRGQTLTAASIGAEARTEAPAKPVAVPTPAAAPVAPTGAAPEAAAASALAPEAPEAVPVDSTGRPWDERIDSSNRGTNADGTWRARRGVAPELRGQVLAELAELLEANGPKYDEPEGDEPDSTDSTEAPEADAEPSATERHPLPRAAEVAPAAGPVPPPPAAEDLAALVEAVEAIAQDLEGGMMDTLNACKAFTAEHGVAAFNAVKNAVAPTENGQGAPVNLLTPAQRRTLQAAVQTYDAYFASDTQG